LAGFGWIKLASSRTKVVFLWTLMEKSHEFENLYAGGNLYECFFLKIL
jgi:hypothetical protein